MIARIARAVPDYRNIRNYLILIVLYIYCSAAARDVVEVLYMACRQDFPATVDYKQKKPGRGVPGGSQRRYMEARN